MQSLKRFILASVITAFIIVAFGVIPAWAVTLAQKEGGSLLLDGDSASGAYGRLVGGRDSGGAFQAMSIGTDGVLDVDIASSSGTVDTELPAAAAISGDNEASPTAPSVYSFLMGFDTANWDIVRVRPTSGSADDQTTANMNGGLVTASVPFLWDPVDGNWDRWQQVGADTGRAQVSDVTAPSANSPTRFAVSGTSACSADLTTNSEYVLAVESGTDSTIHCCHGDAADCTADQNDQPYFGENHYRIWIHTTNERVCCVSGNAGTATATLDLQTAP